MPPLQQCRQTRTIALVILGIVAVLLILVVAFGANFIQSKYFECAETNTIVGRKEYMEMLKKNDIVVGSGSRTVATVACSPDNIVKYHSRKSVKDILKVHKKAKKRGIDDALAQIIAHGRRFIVYERCEDVTSKNLPCEWRKQFAELKQLGSVEVKDLFMDNIMVCRNRLVMTDQDPATPTESVLFRFHTPLQVARATRRLEALERKQLSERKACK